MAYGMAEFRASDFIIKNLTFLPLFPLLTLFACVLPSFSGRFSPHGDRDDCKSHLPVKKSPWKKGVFSNRCGKRPKRTVVSPSLSHRLFLTCHWPWEGVFFLANPEVVCTPGGRGQGQLHPVTGTIRLLYKGRRGRFLKGKLDRKMSTIDRVS